MVVREDDNDDTAVPDGLEPTIRTHNPMGIDVATIDSYQGQQKKLGFFFSTVSATSGPKFMANANHLCVAEDVAIAFDLPPPHVPGSGKARKLDKPVWAGRSATPPSHFHRAVPSTSFYDKNIKSYTVYLRLEDTSKAARRTFNGNAHLAAPGPDNDWLRDVDWEVDLVLTAVNHEDSTTGADSFPNVICGMNAPDYYEVNLLAGIEPFTAIAIMMSVHASRVQQRKEFLSRVPASVLLIYSAPRCGRSEQLAAAISLCVAQARLVLLTASRHKAMDTCLKKVETVLERAHLDHVIICVFKVSEDKLACKHVFRKDDERPATLFLARGAPNEPNKVEL